MKNRDRRMVALSVRGLKYGIGHSSRVKYLLSYSEINGWSTTHLDITQIVSHSTLFERVISEIQSATCLFIDLDPRFVVESRQVLQEIFDLIPLERVVVVIMDSKTDFPIRGMFPSITFDLSICPYGHLGLRTAENELTGFGATIFDNSLKILREEPKEISVNALSVLVSCGGSDPLDVTSLFLQALNLIRSQKMRILTVIGSHFPISHRTNLDLISRESDHQIVFVESPNSLTSLYSDVDIALVTGGLTRNEVLFMGIPSIVVNIDPEQHSSTCIFESAGGLLQAGTLISGEESQIIQKTHKLVDNLVNNQSLRINLATNARLAMPDGGCEKILREIELLCKAKIAKE